MGNQKTGYVNDLLEVKGILKNMFEIEDKFSFLEGNDAFMWWKLGQFDIYIDIAEDETYYFTVIVYPKIERKGRFVSSSGIYYDYKIKGKHIERNMLLAPNVPAFKDKGKKVLEELISILNSGNLVLKKNKNAP